MKRLVTLVTVVFIGVSAFSVVRALYQGGDERAGTPPLKDPVESLSEQPGDEASAESVTARTEALREETQANHSGAMPEERRRLHEDLSLGIALGFTREEALALIQQTDLEQLEAFFSQRSHITADWLNRQGLGVEHLRELYARWAAGTPPELAPDNPGALIFSRYRSGQDGSPFRAQNRFSAQDRTVYLHYQVPTEYQQASVIIRWAREDQPGLSHFDYHPLTDHTGLRQEAWVRPRQGWEPGTYRVEIYGAEPSLPLIAQRDYEVLP